jgi:hypothetical protein
VLPGERPEQLPEREPRKFKLAPDALCNAAMICMSPNLVDTEVGGEVSCIARAASFWA